MPPEDLSAWERVGPLLAKRRAAIDPRYANRRLFARERGMNWRTLHDAERAKRANFRPEMITAFEGAYMLAPGSLARSLAGGDLEPVPPPAPQRAEPPRGQLAEVPHLDMDDKLIERFIEMAGPNREVLAAMWQSWVRGVQSREVVIGKMIDWLADDPTLPIDWDKGDDGEARDA